MRQGREWALLEKEKEGFLGGDMWGLNGKKKKAMEGVGGAI